MDQIKIGAFLKELRNDNNLTQEQFVEKFGVSQGKKISSNFHNEGEDNANGYKSKREYKMAIG